MVAVVRGPEGGPSRAGRPGRLVLRAAGLAGAVVADRRLAEPPDAWHPVALFGRAMTWVEDRVWADRRSVGTGFAAGGIILGAGAGWAVAKAAAVAGSRGSRRGRGGRFHPTVALAAVTYAAVAGRALEQAAADVADALGRGELDHARTLVRNLVGRDTSELDEVEIVRATVESVAENTVDAVVAPLLWAFLAGAPGVAAYRAVNTLDAMVGHRSDRYERFGWAAARADDGANWIPARATAALVAAVRPDRGREILEAVRRQAPGHPSPNAGVAEAAFAAALGVRLGGVNDYAGRRETRPALGRGPRPERWHIAEACRLSRQATWALVAGLGGGSLVAERLARGGRLRPGPKPGRGRP